MHKNITNIGRGITIALAIGATIYFKHKRGEKCLDFKKISKRIFMNYSIRELAINERDVLETFLYHAIFIPEGVTPPPFEIINNPDLQVYVKDFGKQDSDICYVAECDNNIVGAVWVRIMNDYGHIDEDIPAQPTNSVGGMCGG